MWLFGGGDWPLDKTNETDTSVNETPLGDDEGVVVTPKAAAAAAEAADASSFTIVPEAHTVGFLGLGTINHAVAMGYLSSKSPPKRVIVSPRSAAKSAALAEAFPSLVTVADTNQAVIDAAKVVFIAVLPTQAPDVLRDLTFGPDHVVVSLMAGVSSDALAVMLGGAVPLKNITRAIPLPPVKDHAGVTIVCPKHEETVRVFNLLGTAVAVDDEATMNKMVICTCAMGAYYQFLKTCHQFLVEKEGVDSRDAATYIGALFHSIALDGAKAGKEFGHFDALIAEQTPGGFNEMGIRELREAGVWEEYSATLESLAARWAGKEGAADGDCRPLTSRDELQKAAAAAAAASADKNSNGDSPASTALQSNSKHTRSVYASLAVGVGIGFVLSGLCQWLFAASSGGGRGSAASSGAVFSGSSHGGGFMGGATPPLNRISAAVNPISNGRLR